MGDRQMKWRLGIHRNNFLFEVASCSKGNFSLFGRCAEGGWKVNRLRYDRLGNRIFIKTKYNSGNRNNLRCLLIHIDLIPDKSWGLSRHSTESSLFSIVASHRLHMSLSIAISSDSDTIVVSTGLSFGGISRQCGLFVATPQLLSLFKIGNSKYNKIVPIYIKQFEINS